MCVCDICMERERKKVNSSVHGALPASEQRSSWGMGPPGLPSLQPRTCVLPQLTLPVGGTEDRETERDRQTDRLNLLSC